MDSGLSFAVLGPIRAWRAGEELDLGSPQQRSMLAALLLTPGTTVSLDAIIDAVWGEDVPRTARGTIRTYVHRLRRVLGATEDDQVIRSASGGYQLLVDAEAVDAGRFRQTVAKAEAARSRGETPQAVAQLREALTLWDGPALAGVRSEYLETQRELLHRSRDAASEQLWELELRLGKPADVLDGVNRLLVTEPLRERLHELRILALYQSGRQADALAAYDGVRRLFRDELGADPGSRLQELHRSILRSEPLRPAAPDTAEKPLAPAQLPADMPAYAGRCEEFEALFTLLPEDPGHPLEKVAVSLIKGMAAVGKTTFAVHCAHQLAGRFPDGQLYVDLRGFDAEAAALDPAEVIRGFLDALGVPPKEIPAELDGRAALYRSLLAERRCVILLDNARDTKQVLPLLPGKPGCLVLVTSRHNLPGLVAATGAHIVTLDLMSGTEAVEFLVKRLGEERVRAEPDAARDIIARCDRLPLALAVAAARALSRPTFPLSAIAAELSEATESLDAFAETDGVPDLRAVLSWSYRALSPEAARLFRLLSLHRGTDISAPAAASLASAPIRAVRALLRELTDAHLVSEYFPGRYARHELLRTYATELFLENETAAQHHDANHRMFDHYLHTARAADQQLSTHRDLMPLPPPVAGVTLESFSDYQSASTWLSEEYAVLLNLVSRAVADGLPQYSWQVAWSLRHYQDRLKRWRDLRVVHETSMAAAEAQQNQVGLAYTHRGIARALCQEGQAAQDGRRYDEAEHHLEQALALFSTLGDNIAMAYTLRQANWVAELKGQHRKGLAHAEHALRLFRAAGWARGEAAALQLIGSSHVHLDQAERGLGYFQQAVLLYMEYGEQFGLAHTLNNIGGAYHRLGRYDEAVASYRQAAEAFQELGEVFYAADAFFDLSETFQAAGRPDEARVASAAALHLTATHPPTP